MSAYLIIDSFAMPRKLEELCLPSLSNNIIERTCVFVGEIEVKYYNPLALSLANKWAPCALRT